MILNIVRGGPCGKGIVEERCCPVNDDVEERDVPEVRVLMGVVASSNSAKMKVLLMRNVLALRHKAVKWVVALYEGDRLDSVKAYADSLNVSFQAYDGRPTANLTCPFCPKLSFQLTFLPYLDYIDYIVLPDADMSFADFDWDRYWRSHYRAGSPVISQPIIRQSTQTSGYFVNADQWAACDPEKSIFATTTIIEEQAPFVDAKFFEYLFSRLSNFATMQQEYRSDYGVDLFWCAAAAVFAAAENPETNPERTSCAIILEPIDHHRYHTILQNTDYKQRGSHMLQVIDMIMQGQEHRSLAKELNLTDITDKIPTALMPPCAFSTDHIAACACEKKTLPILADVNILQNARAKGTPLDNRKHPFFYAHCHHPAHRTPYQKRIVPPPRDEAPRDETEEQ